MKILELKKTEFYKSKQPFDLDLINADQISVSDKFKHSDDGFKCFVCYKEGEIVKPFCIILRQMSGYIKGFENGGKTCLSWLKMTMRLINTIQFGARLKRR